MCATTENEKEMKTGTRLTNVFKVTVKVIGMSISIIFGHYISLPP